MQIWSSWPGETLHVSQLLTHLSLSVVYVRQRASVSINTYSIAPDSSSYRHTSSRRQLGAEFVIRAVLHIHHCYPITRGRNRRGDLEGAQTPSCIRGTVDVQKDAGGRPRRRSIIFNIKQPVYKVSWGKIFIAGATNRNPSQCFHLLFGDVD